MSAADFALPSPRYESGAGIRANAKEPSQKWWARFTTHCAGSNCPREGKFWPYWLRRPSGVEHEGRWYCSRTCFEPVLAGRVHTLLLSFQAEKPRAHRLPIGLLLVNRGMISPSLLREALRCQREAGHGRIGDWLCHNGFLTTHQLTAALAQQWGCPVFPLENQSAPALWSDLIPLPLLESAAAVPAYASLDSRILHIAFGERVDHTLLYAVEQMLPCRTFPCVAPAPSVQTQLEHFRKLTSGNYVSFDTIRECSEMTWTICNYATELKPDRIALARAGSYVWVRFFRPNAARDLLFRIAPDKAALLEKPPGRAKALAIPADGGKGGVSHAALPA
jgi:hypothetical protein